MQSARFPLPGLIRTEKQESTGLEMKEAITVISKKNSQQKCRIQKHEWNILHRQGFAHILLLVCVCLTITALSTINAKAAEQNAIASANTIDNVFNKSLRETVTELPAVAGAKSIRRAALEDRPVLVTFFASWCPPCLDEFLLLNAIHKKYENTELTIVAINVYEAWDDNDAARMEKFIQATNPEFPAVVGNESIRNRFGGINRIPTVYGFDKSGALQYQFIHKHGSSKTNATLDELDQAAKMLLGQDV